ncbi:uncharacterized protein A1O5_04344 [Cladophialophora psammophila CBS 110553]|uniref:CHK kinase-like domain-containing protein n=1 Tax=Cladophialophora psammophila CBS 110553 TaxID=1182543 RepID=W9WVA2_9EURO|nr:uncharacterized protein A1O5_04344 [Cladophialophora psammophila CBS 110553]EXJ71843.1 hypothetical protein A1O5_04344 [Cladophialophora psammophila CBS 110553]
MVKPVATGSKLQPVRRVEDIDEQWLERLFGHKVVISAVEGVGKGDMSKTVRVKYQSENSTTPSSLIVKFATENAKSRASANQLGVYAREVTFYQHYARLLGDAVPFCHAALLSDDGNFTLALEDIKSSRVGDEMHGCSPEQTKLGLRALARIQGPALGNWIFCAGSEWLNKPVAFDDKLYLQTIDKFVKQYSHLLNPEHLDVCLWLAKHVSRWYHDLRPPLGVVHGDYRLDNMIFSGNRCAAVDWQTISWGSAMRDASYYMALTLEEETRRQHERKLFDDYFDHLCLHSHAAVIDRETCWDDFVRQSPFGIVMSVTCGVILEASPRGKELVTIAASRYAQHVIDLNAMALIEADGRKGFLPQAADESTHEPASSEFWCERWSFQATSGSAANAVSINLRRTPSRLKWLLGTAISLAGQDVCSIQTEVETSITGDLTRLETKSGNTNITAEINIEQPLELVQLRLKRTGDSPLDLDLSWSTKWGVPVNARVTPGYEIPCQATGTVRYGSQRISFQGPGRRTHFWGPWSDTAMECLGFWCHLEDGSYLGGLGLFGKSSTSSAAATGSIQRDGTTPTQDIVGIERKSGSTANGFEKDIVLEISPSQLELVISKQEEIGSTDPSLPQAGGHSKRYVCRFRTNNGVEGVGMIEYAGR